MKIFFLFLLIGTHFIAPINAIAQSNDIATIPQNLLQQINQTQPWKHPYWHQLLYYHSTWRYDGWLSGAINREFFLDPQGRINPEAELKATVAAFFSDVPLDFSKQTAACTFIARFHWLREQLQWDEWLPSPHCEQYDEFQKQFAKPLSLVFGAYSFTDVSSMVGHLFLKAQAQDAENWYDGISVNHYAILPEDPPFLNYVYKGVLGMYPSELQITDYKYVAANYNENEGRDIWEYPLNFIPQEQERLTRHLWELQYAYFGYYFFNENCVTAVQDWLRIAKPELPPMEGVLWDLPIDTLHQLQAQGVLGNGIHRSARNEQLEYLLSSLSDREKQLALKLAKNPELVTKPEFLKHAPKVQFFLLQAALDYNRYWLIRIPEHVILKRIQFLEQQLAEHSTAPQQKVLLDQNPTPPDQGHESANIQWGVGQSNQSSTFGELEVLGGLHDLLSNDQGYPKFSEGRLLSATLRTSEDNHLHLEELFLARIASLNPKRVLPVPFSWKLNVGWQTRHALGCDDCLVFTTNYGLGKTWEWHPSLQTYLLLGVNAEAGSPFESGYRFGGRLELGSIMNVSDLWKAVISFQNNQFFLGTPGIWNRTQFEGRYTINTNQEWRVRVRQSNAYQEWSLLWRHYF